MPFYSRSASDNFDKLNTKIPTTNLDMINYRNVIACDYFVMTNTANPHIKKQMKKELYICEIRNFVMPKYGSSQIFGSSSCSLAESSILEISRKKVRR